MFLKNSVFILFLTILFSCKKSVNEIKKDNPAVLNFKTVVGANGRVWMDRNLGASQVATSSTDTNSYGDLYQWGRGADGHQLRISNTTSTLSDKDSPGNSLFITNSSTPFDWRTTHEANLWQGLNGINNPCPSGFRLPTAAEWDAERLSWTSISALGAFTSSLKLPLAGIRSGANGSLISVNTFGYYWSSSVSVNGYFAQNLGFNSNTNGSSINPNNRINGFSVRCIMH